MPTIRTAGNILRGEGKTHASNEDIISAQTFPQDYDFNGQNVRYICGMSVPPIMIKRLVGRIKDTGLFD